MGYPFGKKGWKLLDLETRELFVSRDVRFYEEEFPWGALSNEPQTFGGENNMTYSSIVLPDEKANLTRHSDADVTTASHADVTATSAADVTVDAAADVSNDTATDVTQLLMSFLLLMTSTLLIHQPRFRLQLRLLQFWVGV